jgi:hypothetical protein
MSAATATASGLRTIKAERPTRSPRGYGGQFIVVVPRARAVIVMTANREGFDRDADFQALDTQNALLEIIANQFISAL